jgi:predicted nucleotidyltransferase
LDSLGGSFPAIRRSIDLSEEQQHRIRQELPRRLLSDDCSLILFGSTARGEATPGSDVDWTLLIDGPARTEHRRISQEVAQVLRRLNLAEPRGGGAFGTMAFSHDVIHRIGGDSDTNRNLTQRALLLLESVALDDQLIRERVTRLVLQRYVQDETSFLTETGKQNRIPRFLLNDIVRFWRTMAVDYASKRIERGQEGWDSGTPSSAFLASSCS